MPITICLETLIGYFILGGVLEYLLTEYFWVVNHISDSQKTIFLFFLFFLFFSANFFSKNFHSFIRRALIPIICLFLISLFGFKGYRQYYGRLQQIPRIKSLSQNWSIQATKIEIRGKNFGSEHQPGRVFVNDFEFKIVVWGPEIIIAEQLMPAKKFFKGKFYLIRANGIKSEEIDFTIRDPADLNS